MTELNKQPRGIMQVLPELRGGKLAEELSEAFQKVSLAVEEQQKGGKITLTFTIKPGQGAFNALLISDKIKVDEPKPVERGTMMFTDENGSLTRNDPNQMELQGLTVVRHDVKPAAPMSAFTTAPVSPFAAATASSASLTPRAVVDTSGEVADEDGVLHQGEAAT